MDIQSIAPDEMGALTKKFIEQKNVNDRVSIRLKMKAILDYLSTDTDYPPNPLLKKEAAPAPARIAAAPQIGYEAAAGGYGMVQAIGPVEAIPAAVRMDNTEILG